MVSSIAGTQSCDAAVEFSQGNTLSSSCTLATDSIFFPVALYCTSFIFSPASWQIMHTVLSNIPEDDVNVLGLSLSLTSDEILTSDRRPILF